MIELALWNLTIPVGVPATVIETKELNGGYQSDYFKSADGKIQFWAPVNGTTTKGSTYPRSELRETLADGQLHNWKYTAADNYLSAKLEMDQVPSVGRVVIGQIHAKNHSKPMLKMEYLYQAATQTGSIVAKYRTSPNVDDQKVTLAEGVKLDQVFNYNINLSPKGTLSVESGGKKWSAQIDSSWQSYGLYFKAGAYVQDNSGYETEAGAATFHDLKAEHRPL